MRPPDGSRTTPTPILEWAYSDPDGDPLAFTEVQVAENPTFSLLNWQTTVGGPATIIQVPTGQLMEGTTYYWRVRTNDGYMWSDYATPWSFRTDIRPVVQSLAPADGTVTVTAPNLQWTYFDADGDPLVDSEVEVAENPAFSPVKWQTTVTGPATSLQIPAAEVSPGTTYYWRVRTSDGYMWSAYTAPWRFKMDSKPLARNVAPADGVLTTSTPALEWAYSDADGEPLLNTEVQVADDPTFSLLKWQTTLDGPTTSVQLPAGVLIDGAVYYWRVRVKVGLQWSDYSTAWRFIAEIYRETYEHDGPGNITSRTATGTPSLTYTIDSMNRVTYDGSRSFVYDANGNMTYRTGAPTWQYVYDAQDRLISVLADGTELAHYSYDGEGNLVKMFEKQGAADPGKTTVVIYDGLQPIYEEEYQGNTTAGTPIATRTYIHVAGQAIAKIENGTLYYYHRDHLGSTRATSDASGNMVKSLRYTPYGEMLYEHPAPASVLEETKRFTGKPLGFSTGLYYFGARFYDPGLGRFIAQDPARQGVNWYAYANANPLRFIDPTGMWDEESEWYKPWTWFDKPSANYRSKWADMPVNEGWEWMHHVFTETTFGQLWLDFGDDVKSASEWLNERPVIGTGILVGTILLGRAGNVSASGRSAAASRGIAVIGHYPEYVELGQRLNARYFNVPSDVWNKMAPAEQWMANQKFLDRQIAQGSEFILATPFDQIRLGSYLAAEIKYLLDHGYHFNSDMSRLVQR